MPFRKHHYCAFSFLCGVIILALLALYFFISPGNSTSTISSTGIPSGIYSVPSMRIYPAPLFTNSTKHIVFNNTETEGYVIDLFDGSISNFNGYALYPISDDSMAILSDNYIRIYDMDVMSSSTISNNMALYAMKPCLPLKDYAVVYYPPDTYSNAITYFVLDKKTLNVIRQNHASSKDIYSIDYGDNYIYGDARTNYVIFFNIAGLPGNGHIGYRVVDSLTGTDKYEGHVYGKEVIGYGFDSNETLYVMSIDNGIVYANIVDEDSTSFIKCKEYSSNIYTIKNKDSVMLTLCNATANSINVVDMSNDVNIGKWLESISEMGKKGLYLDNKIVIYLNETKLSIYEYDGIEAKDIELESDAQVLSVAVSKDYKYCAVNTKGAVIIYDIYSSKSIKYSIAR